ncbi:class V lanthionine synthetase subunit LxmK [Streptomyces sp. SudanB182_2057]|uniref:class V lanthionine synthetase subunit LxmK n=1 Tax=Streptomyces sp. SudanB182_2057 TaxID=3035281 RepID=UPI003F56795F
MSSIAAQDLSAFPEVDELLGRLGLGGFERDSVTSRPGRNEAWLGRTTNGARVFVKHLRGGTDDTGARLRRLLDFQEFADRIPAGELRYPRLLGHDEPARLVVFEAVDDASSGAKLMVDETFDDVLAHTAGRAVGQLHASGHDGMKLHRGVPPLPSRELLRGISQSLFEQSSFGQLSVFSLMQRDGELAQGIDSLLILEQKAEKVPSHCDLRVDQFLIRGDDLFIADWEEFRLADAARDIGSFAGEWLYRSVLDIMTHRGDEGLVDFELSHDLIVSRGAEKLERLRPRIENFCRGYREVHPHTDPELWERATAFAGWHALDRLIAGAVRSARLSGIERAAAGVGRNALLHPAKFAPALGMEMTVTP